MRKIDISIIIVSFNTKDFTLGCIDSIYSSQTKCGYEIIVIDNKSSDGSVDVLRKVWRKHKNLTLVENKSNLGFAKAVNIGIRMAKGKHVLLLNSDTEVKKGALDKLVEFVEENDDVGVVGAKLLNTDGGIQKSVFHFPTISRAIREYWLGQKGAYELYSPGVNRPIAVDSVMGAAFLISFTARKQVRFLDERYFMYFEDLDYCRKVWDLGLKVYYLPSAEVYHYHGESGKDIVKPAFQWNRLIPSSKIYHGPLKHYLINFVIWSGQKWKKLTKIQK